MVDMGLDGGLADHEARAICVLDSPGAMRVSTSASRGVSPSGRLRAVNPEGYDGWTVPEFQSDEELLEQYANEGRLARRRWTSWSWTLSQPGGFRTAVTLRIPLCGRFCCT
jgi:hypothetical protein